MTAGLVLPFQSQHPVIHPHTFIAPGAHIIGDVTLHPHASVWFNAVLRGDVQPIHVGPGTNIQDLAVVHASSQRTPTSIGQHVTIGHRAIIHGCTIDDHCLIGMGAIVMDDAVIGELSIVGAGSLVTERTHIPPRTLALGSPARPVRPLKPREIDSLRQSAQHYIHAAQSYLDAGIGRPHITADLPS